MNVLIQNDMDVTVRWVKPEADAPLSLVEALLGALVELQQFTFVKWGRAKRVSCDVYTHVDVIGLLAMSDGWKPVASFDLKRPLGSHSEHVGDIGGLRLYRDRIMGPDTIRMVAVFDVNDGVDKTMYGNVLLSL